MRGGWWKIPALILLLIPACEAEDPERVIPSRETFVAVYADLRGAEGEEAAVRDSILAEHGVTEEELRRFVHHHADRPRVLADIWAEITAEAPQREEAVEPEPRAPELEGARPQTPMEDPAMPEAVRPRRELPPAERGGDEEPLPRPPSPPNR